MADENVILARGVDANVNSTRPPLNRARNLYDSCCYRWFHC